MKDNLLNSTADYSDESDPRVLLAASSGRLPRWAPMQVWCDLSGYSRSRTYIELGTGELRAKKAGKRILIDVDHGMRRLDSLPDAMIKPPSAQRRVVEQAAA